MRKGVRCDAPPPPFCLFFVFFSALLHSALRGARTTSTSAKAVRSASAFWRRMAVLRTTTPAGTATVVENGSARSTTCTTMLSSMDRTLSNRLMVDEEPRLKMIELLAAVYLTRWFSTMSSLRMLLPIKATYASTNWKPVGTTSVTVRSGTTSSGRRTVILYVTVSPGVISLSAVLSRTLVVV